MTRIRKALLIVVVAPIALCLLTVGGAVVYFYATYIDETVTEGAAYGFAIGQTKVVAFSLAKRQVGGMRIAGVHVNDPFKDIELNADGYELLKENATWTLFAGERGDFFDTITLRFENDEIYEIHRHRQRIEFP